MRARLRFFFSPSRAKTLDTAWAWGQNLVFRGKVAQNFGLVGHSAQPTAHIDPKAPLLLAVYCAHLGQEAHIVQHYQTAGFLLAARKGDFEFAAKVLHVVVAEQKPGQRVGVRGCVEGFGAADAGQLAAGNVAHGVATRLAGGDAHSGQTAHQIGRVLDVDVVQLDVLAGGHMQDAVRVFISQLRQHIQLLRVQTAIGHFNAHHSRRVPIGVWSLHPLRGEGDGLALEAVVALAVVVALTVDTPAQTALGKDPLVQFALASQEHLPFKNVDLVGHIIGHVVLEAIFPGQCDGSHWVVLSIAYSVLRTIGV